jgi:hypothetical protein
MAKPGSLCGHMQQKCPNCKEDDIGFSSRCVKKSKADKRHSREVKQK